MICPNLPKYISLLLKSFLSNFFRHLAIFSGHTGCRNQTLDSPGANVINKYFSSVGMLRSNKALWMDSASHVTSFSLTTILQPFIGATSNAYTYLQNARVSAYSSIRTLFVQTDSWVFWMSIDSKTSLSQSIEPRFHAKQQFWKHQHPWLVFWPIF